MDFYDVIKNRRSCRVFKPDPIPTDVLERIVEAALWAPSGKNRQNYRVFVVAGEKKEELVSIADHADTDACDGRLDGHTGIHKAQRCPANRSHRRRAV